MAIIQIQRGGWWDTKGWLRPCRVAVAASPFAPCGCVSSLRVSGGTCPAAPKAPGIPCCSISRNPVDWSPDVSEAHRGEAAS